MKPFLVPTNTIVKYQNTIYLGVWAANNHTKSITMPYLWSSGEKNLHAAQKCEKYYEYFLDILTKELNAIHKINQSKQYYRVILGNWLLHYIHVHYDRFMSIYLFHKKYGDFDTKVLSNEEYFVPNDFFDFTSQVKSDPYNFQIYSNVIHFLFSSQKFEVIKSEPIRHIVRPAKSELKKNIEKIFTTINKMLNSFQTKTILISSPYLGENGMLKIAKLVLKSKFRVLYDDMNVNYMYDKSPVENLRKKVPIASKNLFKKFIGSNILKDIPMIYLEEFNDFRINVKKQSLKQIPSILYTSIGMQGNDAVKFYIAEHLASSMKTIINQHGASYGTSAFHILERYERSVSDYFFSSGWSETSSTIPFGIPKLCKEEETAEKGSQITYLTTYHPKYLVRFDIYPNSGYYHTVFFERMEQFFSTFSLDTIGSFQIKSYPNKDCFTRIEEIVEKLSLDIDIIYSRKLSDIFSESKLIIMDHMGTSMLEAFAVNKPIVVVLDPNIEIFREDAQAFMDTLERVGVVHFSIVGAASHINKIQEDVGQWWNTQEVQETVTNFREHYAKCDTNWMDALLKQFDEIGTH